MTKALCALTLVLLLSTRAFSADARALFERGTKALEDGRPQAALKAFQASYKAQPSPSLFFWIAEAHRALGHDKRAAKYYRQYLAKAPDGQQRAEAKARLAEMRNGKKNKLAMEDIDLSKAPAAAPLPLPLPAPESKPSESAADLPPLPLPAAPPPAQVAQPKPVEPAPTPAPPAVVVAKAEPTPPVAKAEPAKFPSGPPVMAPRPRTETPFMQKSRTEGEMLFYVQYTARLLAPNGSFMSTYSTTSGTNTLFTHGIGVGVQSEYFRNGLYFGFGTQYGGPIPTGSDTLLRYELSWQFAWLPLGQDRVLNPHAGFRLGGMGIQSERLTGGQFNAGFVLAPEVGLDIRIINAFLLTAAVGYDGNLLIPNIGPNNGLSGFAADFGGAVRF